MPELPEVETTRRGIAPAITGKTIRTLQVRNPRLRWPVPEELAGEVEAQVVESVTRRAKYLLLNLPNGSVIVHLGMSGSLRVVTPDTPLRKHDHVDFVIDSGAVLRFHDPRRFGCVLWQPAGEVHPLLASLGPEPLGPEFSGQRLFGLSRKRKTAVKPFLMDQAVVVGVGNIYATEALYRAGIDPRRPAGRISAARYELLAEQVRGVLAESIERGGTTLRDYVDPQGSPGWFALQLSAYERAGEPCARCQTPIRRVVLGQRASFYCPQCQR